jgi:hypothetical protein
VLLSTPLHASSNFTVSVQLANKRGFKQKLFLPGNKFTGLKERKIVPNCEFHMHTTYSLRFPLLKDSG